MPNVALAVRSLTPPPVRRPSFAVICGSGTGPALPPVTLRDLIRLRLAEEAVRERFVEAWLPVVETEVRRYGARGGSTEELRAEGNLALWEAALQYDPQLHRTAPATYIHNHIHRRVRRAYRESMGFDRQAEVGAPAGDITLIGQADDRLGAIEQAADVEQAVSTLRPDEQEPLRRYLDLSLSGMGPDEIARAMAAADSVPFATAKKRLERLRKKVRTHLSRL